MEQLEQKILSPIDGNADYCFRSEDPTTNITSYLDYGTGYTSNSHLVTASAYVEQAEANQPKLVTELKVLFPMGTLEDWTWEVMKVREVTESEKEKYPIPETDGEFFKTILDVKGKKNFSKDKFMDALKEIGGVVDLDG